MSNYTKENLINIPTTAVPAGTLAMKVGNEIFTPGNIRISSGGMDFYKCASVDTTSKTWTGYLAVLGDDGTYSFEGTATTGLTYGKGFTPEVDGVYDTEALISVKSLTMPLPSPVLYLPLDNIGPEASTGQSLTYTGNPVTVMDTETDAGVICVQFDGSSTITTAADPENFPVGDSPRTLAGRARFTRDGDGAWRDFVFGYGSVDNDALSIGLNNYKISCFTGDTIQSDTNVDTSKWYHIAVTYENGTLKLYIDGVAVKTASKSLNTSSDAVVYVGFLKTQGIYNFMGYVSDVRLYAAALNDNEIARLAAEAVYI